jgi:adenylate cyclase
VLYSVDITGEHFLTLRKPAAGADSMLSFQQLKDRKVVQWALAYLAGAWALLQVTDLVGDRFGWPDLWLRLLIVSLAVGFPAALVLAWYHGEKGRQRVSGPELLMLTGILVVAGSAVMVVGRGSPADAAPGSEELAARLRSAPEPPAERSIAVLPFVDMSPEKDQEYFSDGITEELLNALAQVEGLRVAARTSSFSFKGRSLPVDSVGRALRVAHLLEGSVRKDGNRLRITAQLVNAADGYHLWSQNYDRELKDVFQVQDEIARAITQVLRIKLAEGAGAPLVRQTTPDPQAHDLLLRGWYYMKRGNYDLGLEHFERAIQRDPQFAMAYHGVATVYLNRAHQDRNAPVGEYLRRAREAAERALELDPLLSYAHRAIGDVHMSNWDFAAAEQAYLRGYELAPNDAWANWALAYLRAFQGRDEEALVLSRRAVELDPLEPLLACLNGHIHVYVRRYEDALRQLQIAREQHDAECDETWVDTYYMLGQYREAAASARRLYPRERDSDEAALLTQMAEDVLDAKGRGEPPRPDYVRRVDQSGMSLNPYNLVKWYTWAGDHDAAFRLLERLVAERNRSMVWVTSPVFGELWVDPRYQALLAQMGVPAYRAR